ncbi:ATP-binding protein [Cellulomonas sp. URHE0023]|uniref:ATP-binding protein n=1 Tax=Cellulomonas sp. URHE0023 TaxID=1380354 RepID=UPI00054F620B|nr:ATP-binding protein [Cellulomonas sp. URHE0023]
MYAETAVSPALSSIAPARHWTRDRLAEAGVTDGPQDTVILLVSELVTNAVAHADPPVILRVHVDEERTRVEVADGARQELPVVLDPPPTATGGRGVMFVDRLASRWGTTRNSGSKAVWFEVRHGDAPTS